MSRRSAKAGRAATIREVAELLKINEKTLVVE